MALRGGLFVPFRRFGIVALHAVMVFIHQAYGELRLGQTVGRGHFVALHGKLKILLGTLALFAQHAQPPLRLAIAVGGSLLVPSQSLHKIFGGALPVFKHKAQVELCFGQTLCRRQLVELHGFNVVLGYASGKMHQHRHVVLRLGRAFGCLVPRAYSFRFNRGGDLSLLAQQLFHFAHDTFLF